MIRMHKKGDFVTYIIDEQIKHVYVVVELPDTINGVGEAKVHGVFANREHAEAKSIKLHTRHHKSGYIAVLKKKIKGA